MDIIVIITTLIMLAIGIFYLIAMGVILKKAGYPGWFIIIPIYGQYLYYKVAWTGIVFIIVLLLSILSFATRLLAVYSLGIAGFVSLVICVATIVIYFITNYKLAKRFGHGLGFSLGISFLPFIFIPILGFGSSVYEGGETKQEVAKEQVPSYVPDFDGPITEQERNIINQIREKRANGDTNYSETEKSVLMKLKYRKEHDIR